MTTGRSQNIRPQAGDRSGPSGTAGRPGPRSPLGEIGTV